LFAQQESLKDYLKNTTQRSKQIKTPLPIFNLKKDHKQNQIQKQKQKQKQNQNKPKTKQPWHK